MQKVLTTKFSLPRLSTYAAIIMMFTYSILLGRDFECTCRPQGFECNLYVALPVFTIFVLILWTDRSFQRICGYMCGCGLENRFRGRCHTCGFLFSLLLHITQAALVSVLWAAFVFLSGDWYVCCLNDHSEQQAQLACKHRGSLSDKERVIIAELKNKSRVIGSFLLFGIICVAGITAPFGWRKCCEGRLTCCDRSIMYEILILEEEENVLRKILKTSAKETLAKEVKDKIQGTEWKKCFDVAETLIKGSIRPTLQPVAADAQVQV